MTTRTLRYYYTDNGFCRVYYRDTNPENKTLYAMQIASLHPAPTFSLMVCSRDGEPSHNADARNFVIPESKGNESTDQELNDFLENQAAGVAA